MCSTRAALTPTRSNSALAAAMMRRCVSRHWRSRAGRDSRGLSLTPTFPTYSAREQSIRHQDLSSVLGPTAQSVGTRMLSPAPMSPRNLLDKVWDAHTVRELPGGQTQLFIGLHLIHEVTSPQAFAMLREMGVKVRFPQRTFATVDH